EMGRRHPGVVDAGPAHRPVRAYGLHRLAEVVLAVAGRPAGEGGGLELAGRSEGRGLGGRRAGARHAPTGEQAAAVVPEGGGGAAGVAPLAEPVVRVVGEGLPGRQAIRLLAPRREGPVWVV